MSKQRAFVRYTKSGRVVPGSLILTNGSYPAGPALWQEVIVDMCCKPCDCRTIKGFEIPWSFTDCDGNQWGCSGVDPCLKPPTSCIDVSKPYRGVIVGPVSCECQCITPVSCNCYLIVNPSLGGEPLGYNFRPCGSESGIGGMLGPGESTMICANTDSVELSGGLLISNNGTCSPEAYCGLPSNPCVSYDISGNSVEPSTVIYRDCNGNEHSFTISSYQEAVRICAQLGSVDAPGTTATAVGIGCLA